jgi:hypothetical protein
MHRAPITRFSCFSCFLAFSRSSLKLLCKQGVAGSSRAGSIKEAQLRGISTTVHPRSGRCPSTNVVGEPLAVRALDLPLTRRQSRVGDADRAPSHSETPGQPTISWVRPNPGFTILGCRKPAWRRSGVRFLANEADWISSGPESGRLRKLSARSRRLQHGQGSCDSQTHLTEPVQPRHHRGVTWAELNSKRLVTSLRWCHPARANRGPPAVARSRRSDN